MTNYKSGKIAEIFARLLFIFKGYTILSKNFKTGKGFNIGEVDFVACKKNVLVFVEVKKRSSLKTAAYAISEKQKQRIIRGAELYIKTHRNYKNYNIRFDAVLIAFPCYIQHIKNAWICENMH
jgi:putative endonuclease